MSIFGDIAGGLFGGSDDNSKAFKEYAAEMRNRMPVYDPWVQAGDRARNLEEAEFKKLIENPNFLQDLVAKGYQASPYQNYITDMVTKRMNMNAANTGMLGSGAANRALQQELTGMTGQFLNDYIGRGMGSYNQGLGGMESLRNMGFNSLQAQDQLLSQAAGAQLQGQLSKNASESSFLKNLLGTALNVGGGFAFGGVPGAVKSLGFDTSNTQYSPFSSIQNMFQPRPMNIGGGTSRNYNTGNYAY